MKKEKHSFNWSEEKNLFIQKNFPSETNSQTTDLINKSAFDPSKMRIFNTFEVSQWFRFIVALNWIKDCIISIQKNVPTKHIHIADLGCSHSQLYKYWKNNCNFFNRPHITYYGVDAYLPRIELGRKDLEPRKGDELQYFLADLTHELKFPNYFDIMVCMETIEHVPKESVITLLKNISNHMLSHGYAIISSPNPLKAQGECWSWGKASNGDHIYEWGFDEIKSQIRAAGLKIVAHTGILPRKQFRTKSGRKTMRQGLQKFLPYSIAGNVLCLGDMVDYCHQWMALVRKK